MNEATLTNTECYQYNLSNVENYKISLKPSNKTKMSTTQNQIEHFDLVRFTFADINGIYWRKAMPRQHVGRFMKESKALSYTQVSSRASASHVGQLLYVGMCARVRVLSPQHTSRFFVEGQILFSCRLVCCEFRQDLGFLDNI